MRLVVSVEGVDTLSLKVKYLITAAQRGIKEGTSEAAGLFVAEAKAQVPVKTGRLQNSIQAIEQENTAERYVMAVTPALPATNKWGFDPPYARRVEYGFIGVDSLGRHYHQEPRPYMRPAFMARQDEAAAAIKEGTYGALELAMNQVAARRARR